jgi:threonylcarbamoyladenosine tRNA methylthiotransferase MtaB
MPQLPRTLVKERAARLRAKGDAARTARLDAMIGTRHTILMERGGIGRTPCFTPVEIGGAPHGAFLPVTITHRNGDKLAGIAA